MWNEPAGGDFGGAHHGPQGVAGEVFSNISGLYEAFRVTPDRYVDGGDTIVVIGELTASVRETGADLSVPFAHVCEIEDGRMVRFTNVTDTETVQQAHGN